MRAFLDAILVFINCSTLTDPEWAEIDELNDQSYTLVNYNALLGTLDARESVSSARDRLRFYFQAAGLTVEESSAGKSKIFIGGALDS